ncbi:MAG: type IV pilus twitching motility protein PilT [Desulfovibrionaceae bacterium]
MERKQLDALMGQVLDFGPKLSDIIITAGKRLQAEMDGVLGDVPTKPDLGVLTPELTKAFALALIAGNKRLAADLTERGSCDCSYALGTRARFRVNIFKQRKQLAVIMRKLPSKIPGMDDLKLPDAFRDMTKEKYGLILVTGGTGTGKSNSLAAVIDAINAERSVHIITLEDPVEFSHPHKKGTVSQREMGADFDTFASALRAALRQAPKVVLVGEIRDAETMDIALQAAGTGHLVLSTLHTNDAGSAINRVLGLFEPHEERLVRMRLAESLRFVACQRLLPRAGGGRVAAFEVLRNTLRVRELILNGESEEKTFYGVLEQGGAQGMFTFDQCLLKLYLDGAIAEDTALLAASDRSKLTMLIDQEKTRRGESSSDLVIEGLEMDDGLR